MGQYAESRSHYLSFETGSLLATPSALATRALVNNWQLLHWRFTMLRWALGLLVAALVTGFFAFLGLAVLVATAVLALDLVLPAWLAALIVAVALFAIAGVLALVGKKDVEKGSPPVPTEAISSVKADIATVKESARR